MIIRIFLSLFTLSLVAFLGINYAKKKSPYVYNYSLSINSNRISKNALNDNLLKDIEFYQKRLKFNPNRYQDMTALAKLYNNRAKSADPFDNFQLAQRYAYKSINIMPKPNPQSYFVLADIAYYQHDYNSAINYAKIILSQTKSVSAEAFLILAQSYLAIGSMVEANNYADELIQNFPSERAYTLRAIVLSFQGRDQEARSDFEHAIGLNEDDPIQGAYTRAMYAKFYLENSTIRRNLEMAQELLSESVRIYPTYPPTLDALGDYYDKNNNFSESAKYYKLAFHESKQLNYLFKEAIAHKKAGENEFFETLSGQVENLLRVELKSNKMINRKPDSLKLIRFLLIRGFSKDYLEAMNLAKNEIKNNGSIEAILLYSWSLEMNDKLTEAQKSIRSLLNRNVRSLEVLSRALAIEEKINTKSLPANFPNIATSQRSL